MERSSYPPKVATLAALVLAGVYLFNLERSRTMPPADMPGITNEAAPAHVTPIAGTDLQRVTLTERAAQRLDIKTDFVRAAPISPKGSGQTMIPYAAVLYDADGATWTYTNPEPLGYVRHSISVDSITGDQAILLDGPPVGTAVVTTGGAELLGVEFGVGK